jgi:hypothetical protein
MSFSVEALPIKGLAKGNFCQKPTGIVSMAAGLPPKGGVKTSD